MVTNPGTRIRDIRVKETMGMIKEIEIMDMEIKTEIIMETRTMTKHKDKKDHRGKGGGMDRAGA